MKTICLLLKLWLFNIQPYGVLTVSPSHLIWGHSLKGTGGRPESPQGILKIWKLESSRSGWWSHNVCPKNTGPSAFSHGGEGVKFLITSPKDISTIREWSPLSISERWSEGEVEEVALPLVKHCSTVHSTSESVRQSYGGVRSIGECSCVF